MLWGERQIARPPKTKLRETVGAVTLGLVQAEERAHRALTLRYDLHGHLDWS